ncbi:MAG: hypothetical protein M3M88_03185 [Thermoproteota archaeon]|nr:hypothetical protein [Thermoproteota archaeon]
MNIPDILNARVVSKPFIMTMLFFFLVSSPAISIYAQSIPPSGTVKIITHVINDNGGTKQASDFSNCIDTSSPGSSRVHCSSGNEQGNVVSSIHNVPFKVSEDPATHHTGYTVSYSAGCSGSISSGETSTCTITYNDSPPAPIPSPGNGPITIFSLPKIFG